MLAYRDPLHAARWMKGFEADRSTELPIRREEAMTDARQRLDKTMKEAHKLKVFVATGGLMGQGENNNRIFS